MPGLFRYWLLDDWRVEFGFSYYMVCCGFRASFVWFDLGVVLVDCAAGMVVWFWWFDSVWFSD